MIDLLAAITLMTSPTINLTDVPNIDTMPVCYEEDGSDSTIKPCVWTNQEGDSYITYADHSVRIIDNTVR